MTAPSLGAGSAGDVEGLAEELYTRGGGIFWRGEESWQDHYLDVARDVAASDWLATHVARASTADRERVARVEALADAWENDAERLAPADGWGDSIGDTCWADCLRRCASDLRAALAAPPIEPSP